MSHKISGATSGIPQEIFPNFLSASIVDGPFHASQQFLDRFGLSLPNFSSSSGGNIRGLFAQISDYTTGRTFLRSQGTSLITNQPIDVSRVRQPDGVSPLTLGGFMLVSQETSGNA